MASGVVMKSLCTYSYKYTHAIAHVIIHLYIYIILYLCTYKCTYVYPSTHLSLCPSVCLSIYPSIYLSIYQSFDRSTYTHPSVYGYYLAPYLNVHHHLSICLLFRSYPIVGILGTLCGAPRARIRLKPAVTAAAAGTRHGATLLCRGISWLCVMLTS